MNSERKWFLVCYDQSQAPTALRRRLIAAICRRATLFGYDLPTIYVDSYGVATFFRPAPRSIMGVTGSIVAGYRLRDFLSLGAEPILRNLLWRNNPSSFVQVQLTKGTDQ